MKSPIKLQQNIKSFIRSNLEGGYVAECLEISVVTQGDTLMEPNMLKRVGLKQELERLFDKEVDVIRYRKSMNPYLKSEIDREAIYA